MLVSCAGETMLACPGRFFLFAQYVVDMHSQKRLTNPNLLSAHLSISVFHCHQSHVVDRFVSQETAYRLIYQPVGLEHILPVEIRKS